MAQELLQGYHSLNGDDMTLKIDLMKAFDSVRWNFITEVLRVGGFPNRFIGWVNTCISSTSYSVSINGSLHGYFPGAKGLRRGSLVTFFLGYMYGHMSKLLAKNTSQSGFNYHWRCLKTKLTHLCFAIDLMIFCKADVTSATIIKHSLTTFSNLSSLTPNTEKSNIFSSNLSTHNLILNFLAFNVALSLSNT